MKTSVEGKGYEARATPREGYCFHVRMAVKMALSGPVLVWGVSKNVSLTGMCVRVHKKVSRGARCNLQFPHAAGRISPQSVRGTVRYVAKSRSAGGAFKLGVEFDTPLNFIKHPVELS